MEVVLEHLAVSPVEASARMTEKYSGLAPAITAFTTFVTTLRTLTVTSSAATGLRRLITLFKLFFIYFTLDGFHYINTPTRELCRKSGVLPIFSDGK